MKTSIHTKIATLSITCTIAIIVAALAAPAVSAQPEVSLAELEEMKKSLEAQNIICAIGKGVSNDEMLAHYMSSDNAMEQIATSISKTKGGGNEGGVVVSGAEVHERATEFNEKTGRYTIYTLVALAPKKQEAAKQPQAPASPATTTFTDPRDGKIYRTVKIGGRTWMAENLNFQAAKSWCYDNADSSCTKYGRLYSWHAAMKACPAGWRLPSNNDWDNLMRAVGGKQGSGSQSSIWEDAGTRLKSTSGWPNNGNGTDDFGFSALRSGRRCTQGFFEYLWGSGHWWSATEHTAACCAYDRFMYFRHTDVWVSVTTKETAFSVRCVRVRE